MKNENQTAKEKRGFTIQKDAKFLVPKAIVGQPLSSITKYIENAYYGAKHIKSKGTKNANKKFI